MAPHISDDATNHHVLSNGNSNGSSNGSSNGNSNGNSNGVGVGVGLRDGSLTRQHEQHEPVEKTRKSALVTGADGQDGSYLCELLLEKGYTVHGLIRHHSKVYSQEPARRLLLTTPAGNGNGNDAGNGHGHGHGTGEIHYHYGDVLDSFSLIKILRDANPDEIYHLAAQSHVGLSFTTSLSTSQVDALGTLRILEAIQALGLANKIRFYNACSSEVYGAVNQQHALKMLTQDENTPFNPRSPYAVAKLYSYYTTVIFRDRGVFAVNGILFNHESPRRGMDFVTRKISRAVALIYHGEDPQLTLGNLDAFRDWGHARDYVRGMWMMMQQAEADDYVLATGETHSVRTFCEQAFRVIGITLKWQGQVLTEVGIDSSNSKSGGRVLVKVDSALERPLEVGYLRGSAKKAEEKLGWKPEITFQQLVREMVTADIEAIGNGQNLKSVDGPQL